MLILLLVSLEVAALAGPPSAVPFEKIKSGYRSSETVLLDRSGKVLDQTRSDSSLRRLAWTGIEELSAPLKRALLLSEDRRFFEHDGVDWLSFGKAILEYPLPGKTHRGASTISMQVASLLAPKGKAARRRTVGEKITQMRGAWMLEDSWTKEQILEAYFNLVSFRGELQGIRAAAEGLFGKSPHGLETDEAILLSVLVRAPNAPTGDVGKRACLLAQEFSDASSCVNLKAKAQTILASSYVIRREEQRLTPVLAAKLAGPAQVKTTLDIEAQKIALRAVRRQIEELRGRNVADGAALVLDVKSGAVLAYVSNAGRGSSAGFVDGVKSPRQLGSTLKPFLYATAIENRLLTAASILDDTPADFPVLGGIYRPRNHDERFNGPVSLRLALGSSLNVPAVRTVGLVGVENFMAQLRRLGFNDLKRDDFYGPSIALGSADATLWELTNAYRALANGGVWSSATFEEKDRKPQKRQVFSEQTAYIIQQILSDREARHLSFGLESPLATRFWSAVKTGTSKDMRDNWCVGFDGRYVVGVWVGNFDGRPMHDVSGATGAAPAWSEILSALHARRSGTGPVQPQGVIRAKVLLPGEALVSEEVFLKGTEPRFAQTRLAEHSGRITYPAHEMIAALDQDIPTENQRILFRTDSTSAGFHWRLNGAKLSGHGHEYEWEPKLGKHRLELLLADGSVADAVSFEVR